MEKPNTWRGSFSRSLKWFAISGLLAPLLSFLAVFTDLVLRKSEPALSLPETLIYSVFACGIGYALVGRSIPLVFALAACWATLSWRWPIVDRTWIGIFMFSAVLAGLSGVVVQLSLSVFWGEEWQTGNLFNVGLGGTTLVSLLMARLLLPTLRPRR
jgi:hypothetical protein